MTTFFIAGFIGGTIRAIVGILKYLFSYKDVKIKWFYFSGITLISGLIGLSAAWVILELGLAFEGIESVSPAIALMAPPMKPAIKNIAIFLLSLLSLCASLTCT